MAIVNTAADLEAVVAAQPDIVFLGVKFVPLAAGADQEEPGKVWVAEFLKEHGIISTGSSHFAHQLEFDKILAKRRVRLAGLATSQVQVIRQNSTPNRNEIRLGYPVFVKPVNMGGGAGVDANSVASNYRQLIAKAQSIHAEHQSDAMIESYLPGREFSVAILKNNKTQQYQAWPIELVAPPASNGVRVLGAAVKTANAEKVYEVTDSVVRLKVTALALEVFQALGARDYGRVDIRFDQAGMPQFLEANLMPSLISGYGSFPKACLLNENIPYEQMILRIVDLALTRAGQDEPILEQIEPPLQITAGLAVVSS